MGIPENIQKGLLFFVGMDIALDESIIGELPPEIILGRLSKRIKWENGQVVLPDDCAEFYPDPIVDVLLALALQVEPEFTPRTITLPSGASFPSYPESAMTKLPPIEPLCLGNMEKVSQELFSRVGDAIEGFDPELIIISGLHFFDSRVSVDRENTINLCHYALQVITPHMRWLRYCFYYSRDQITGSDMFPRVLQAFIQFEPDVHFFAQSMYHSMKSILPTEEEIDIVDFRKKCITVARELVEVAQNKELARTSPSVAKYAELFHKCALEFQSEPDYKIFRESEAEALEDLDIQVKSQWGYDDLLDKSVNLYPGQRYDRFCCILTASIRDAVVRAAPPQKKSILDKLKIPGKWRKER